MAFSLRVSASFRFPLYGMHGVSATRPIGHESFFQASIEGSTRGTLSTHHKVNTRKDGFHLSPRDFANSLGQLPLIDGHKLRHIRDGIAI